MNYAGQETEEQKHPLKGWPYQSYQCLIGPALKEISSQIDEEMFERLNDSN